MIKRLAFAVAAFLTFSLAEAQPPCVELRGVVTDYYTGSGLRDASVAVSEGGDTVRLALKKDGSYGPAFLDCGRDYTVTYSMDGRVTKRLRLDVTGVPDGVTDYYQVFIQAGLFEWVPDFDFGVFDRPIGLESYKHSVRNLSWENAYTDSVMALVNRTMEEYDKVYDGYRGAAWDEPLGVVRYVTYRSDASFAVDSVAGDTLAADGAPEDVWEPEAIAPAALVGDTGVFFSVQVGVYSAPVPLGELYGLGELNIELMDDGRVRYTSGRFDAVKDAEGRVEEAVAAGVRDAFVVAYVDGERVSLREAARAMSAGR